MIEVRQTKVFSDWLQAVRDDRAARASCFASAVFALEILVTPSASANAYRKRGWILVRDAAFISPYVGRRLSSCFAVATSAPKRRHGQGEAIGGGGRVMPLKQLRLTRRSTSKCLTSGRIPSRRIGRWRPQRDRARPWRHRPRLRRQRICQGNGPKPGNHIQDALRRREPDT